MKLTILITGSSGFLGKNLLDTIEKQNLHSKYKFLMPSSKELNLLDYNSVVSFFNNYKVDGIIHAAAICGGIGLNKKQPADLTHFNNKMTVNIFDAIRNYNIKYFIGLGTVCSYPKFCPVPFKEDDIWNYGGKSEETNHGYGEAKKMLITEFQTHVEQYGLKGVMLVPTNMFGFYDHFNDLKNNHVIPALINKFMSAIKDNLPYVECWGDGSATRDFIFSADICAVILTVLENKIHYYEPINLGVGKDISIKDLAELIKKLTDFNGDIIFTGEVSDGQPKRLLDVSRALQLLNWTAQTKLEDGLKKTIEWYRENK